jgi:hypothetical protein
MRLIAWAEKRCPPGYGVTGVETVRLLLAGWLSTGAAALSLRRWVNGLPLALKAMLTVALAPAAKARKRHTLTAAIVQ